jgi:hypothetical protein
MPNTEPAKTRAVPDAAIATFAATILVLMISVPATRGWMTDQFEVVTAFLGRVSAAALHALAWLLPW